MTNQIMNEVSLFQTLRSSLRGDLVSLGFPNPVAGTILNWFDPGKPEYLEHVDTWQKTLCAMWNKEVPFIPKGTLVRNPVEQICAIQQVAKLVYKWHGEPRQKTDWVAVAKRLSYKPDLLLTDVEIDGVRSILNRIVPIDLNEVRGRFGPGATAEGFNEKDKWDRRGAIPDVPPALYRCNPHDPWQPTSSLLYRCTKMAEVPKSIKCNRIVSSEPAMSMYAQLAINDWLVSAIHRLFRGHVSLHDQKLHNQYLYWPEMVTLDLSDASDHCRCELVELVLPQLWQVLAKVRSEYAQPPNAEAILLTTFAPMGAGFCFSIMTTVILGIVAYAIKAQGGNWREAKWSVYGDDIIIDARYADLAEDMLERAGFVINTRKSCYTGDYVESCGLELCLFRDITPAYIRDDLTTLSADTVEVIVSTLVRHGFDRTAMKIFDISEPAKGLRYNKYLQEWELLVRTYSVRGIDRPCDGYSGLNRWFAVRSQQELTASLKPETDQPQIRIKSYKKVAWRYRPTHLFQTLTPWVLEKHPPKGKLR